MIVLCLVAGFAATLRAQGTGGAAQGPFDDRASSVQFAGTLLVESWDQNGTSETLGGGTVTLARPFRRHWMAMLEGTFLRVSEDGLPDPYLAGFSMLCRRRLYETGPTSLFIEGGPGISYASRPTPAGGTRMNYLIQVGLGALIRVAPRAHVVTGARYLHVSNNSLAGSNRNPDIQAVGVYLGTVLMF